MATLALVQREDIDCFNKRTATAVLEGVSSKTADEQSVGMIQCMTH